ncbi:hypothetical protein VTL71DRAFT_8519 [Oculimacula yallundae]|uniref:Uncharacterized protein n=1 Tax=Oculimacula yallundae TaxID=86028 RepID=A0ABR4CXT9_9HELO
MHLAENQLEFIHSSSPSVVEDVPVFDPKIHLNYIAPEIRFTFDDLELDVTGSQAAYVGTPPFPLFSSEGIIAYRKALFAPEVFENCSNVLYDTLMLRNTAKHSKFIRDLWQHEETIRIISDAAGMDLVPVTEAEIAHTNVQIPGTTVEERRRNLQVQPKAVLVPTAEGETDIDPLSGSIVPWHYDSFPFVCVLMLSDTDGRRGGETYIKKRDGSESSNGSILHGGEVQHLASRARGVEERIATITCFVQKKAGVYDSSYLGRVRPITKLEDLYKGWVDYRLQRMKLEIEAMQARIASEGLNLGDFEKFSQGQQGYLAHTSNQLIAPHVHREVIEKFGQKSLCDCGSMLKQARKLPSFSKQVATVTEDTWMTGKHIRTDFALALKMIAAGKALESQDGRFEWQAGEEYSMGEELVRQGLYEYFLQWFDLTGLWDMREEASLIV